MVAWTRLRVSLNIHYLSCSSFFLIPFRCLFLSLFLTIVHLSLCFPVLVLYSDRSLSFSNAWQTWGLFIMPETGSRLVTRLISKLPCPNAGQFTSTDHPTWWPTWWAGNWQLTVSENRWQVHKILRVLVMIMLTGEIVDLADSEQIVYKLGFHIWAKKKKKNKNIPHILLAEARNIIWGLYVLCPSPRVKK